MISILLWLVKKVDVKKIRLIVTKYKSVAVFGAYLEYTLSVGNIDVYELEPTKKRVPIRVSLD